MSTDTVSSGVRQPRQLPCVTGTARWRGITPTAHTLATGCAWLSIETRQGEAHYWVRSIEAHGRVAGYRLTRFDYESNMPVCDYDVCLDSETCECPDYHTHAQRRPDGLCKHIRALRAALRSVDLL